MPEQQAFLFGTMTLSAAELLQRSNANRQHGLNTVTDKPPAATSPAVLALGTTEALVNECDQLRTIAVWLASELRGAAPLSQAERMAMMYADIGGRCISSGLAIAARRFEHRAHQAGRAAADVADRSKAIEAQSVIVAYMLSKTKGAAGWLKTNGIYYGDKPRPVLRYFGEYLERSRRNAVSLAAMLAERSEDGDDAAVLVAKYRSDGDAG